MRTKKTSVILFAILIMMFAVIGTGCGGDQEENATKYLSEKYGQEFTPLSKGMTNYLNSKNSMSYYTKGMFSEYEYITVSVEKGFLGKKKFHDNYFAYLVRDDVESSVAGMIGDDFGQYFVVDKIGNQALPDTLNKKSKLKDLYKEDPDYMMNIIVFIKAQKEFKEADYIERVNNLEKKLHDTGHKYNLQVFAINDEYYQKINKYDYSEFWTYYAGHSKPDHDVYEYAFNSVIE